MKKIFIVVLSLIFGFSFCGCDRNTYTQTDVFGIGAQTDLENEFFDYFAVPDSLDKTEAGTVFKPSGEYKFTYSEEIEYDETGKETINYYEKDIGTLPFVEACGFSKRLAKFFALQNIDNEYAEEFYSTYPVFYSQDTVEYSYDMLNEKIDANVVLREDSSSEYSAAGKKYSADIVLDNSGDKISFKNTETETIAFDAMVFFVSEENPVDNISSDSIREIYKGNINNWKEISKFDCEINAFTRGEATYNRRYFDKYVMEGEKSQKLNYINLSSPYIFEGKVYKEYPAEYQNEAGSIGYGYASLVKEYYGDSVKILSVDGVYPGETELRKGKYPYTIDVTATVRKDSFGDLGRDVIEWFKSEKGKKAISQCGMVSK